jgi:Nickel responsive protein SCO4226-like
MPRFIIERNIDGASTLSAAELQDIAIKSNEVVAGLGVPYTWITSYVAGDKIYCVHETANPDTVREHARCGGFPADSVVEIAAEIGPQTASEPAGARS